MEKKFIIEFEAEGCDNNCMQSVFDTKTVKEEVKSILESMYGDSLKYYKIRKT